MIHKHLMIRFVRHWHARIGVLAAIFFLFLSITGVALNHTESLSLDKTPISNTALMHWYGLKAETPQFGFKTSYGIVTSSDGIWLLATQRLPISDSTIKGALDWQGMVVLVSPQTLYIVNAQGQLVDTLSEQALPDTHLNNIGLQNGALVLDSASGQFVSDDAISWQALKDGNVVWAKAVNLEPSYQAKLTQYFQPSLPLERVMLDTHSGRIFGRYGPLLMDLVAIVLATLSISGVWIYLRSVRRNKKQL
ncbi:MAG: PepSY-associated TM helix domain-containing protein [Methylophilus sp.]|jgi:hypothetical protein